MQIFRKIKLLTYANNSNILRHVEKRDSVPPDDIREEELIQKFENFLKLPKLNGSKLKLKVNRLEVKGMKAKDE